MPKLWRFLLKLVRLYPVVGLSAVFLAGTVFWGGLNWSMELANTQAFCISCHEMEDNVYKEYLSTAHYHNRTGVRASCPDCHVPQEWIHKVVRKVSATNELLHCLAEDVTDTLEMALEVSGCDRATVVHKPRLLSDNGSSYIAGELADWLDERNMRHTRGAPYHPQTQGKIERWHQTLKNRILLENYYLPGDLEAQIEAFVAHYNHRRYHESLNNLTPADVYFGRGQTILLEREKIKRRTIEHRRLQHRKNAA